VGARTLIHSGRRLGRGWTFGSVELGWVKFLSYWVKLNAYF